MSTEDRIYYDLAETINQTIGRKAVSPRRLSKIVAEAKMIRKTKGTMALMSYAQNLPYQFLSASEIETLRRSSKYREFSLRVIDLFVREKVVTPFEAMMLRRSV